MADVNIEVNELRGGGLSSAIRGLRTLLAQLEQLGCNWMTFGYLESRPDAEILYEMKTERTPFTLTQASNDYNVAVIHAFEELESRIEKLENSQNTMSREWLIWQQTERGTIAETIENLASKIRGLNLNQCEADGLIRTIQSRVRE